MDAKRKPSKQATHPSKRPPKVRVISTGKPPLSGAAAFARLLARVSTMIR